MSREATEPYSIFDVDWQTILPNQIDALKPFYYLQSLEFQLLKEAGMVKFNEAENKHDLLIDRIFHTTGFYQWQAGHHEKWFEENGCDYKYMFWPVPVCVPPYIEFGDIVNQWFGVCFFSDEKVHRIIQYFCLEKNTKNIRMPKECIQIITAHLTFDQNLQIDVRKTYESIARYCSYDNIALHDKITKLLIEKHHVKFPYFLAGKILFYMHVFESMDISAMLSTSQ